MRPRSEAAKQIASLGVERNDFTVLPEQDGRLRQGIDERLGQPERQRFLPALASGEDKRRKAWARYDRRPDAKDRASPGNGSPRQAMDQRQRQYEDGEKEDKPAAQEQPDQHPLFLGGGLAFRGLSRLRLAA